MTNVNTTEFLHVVDHAAAMNDRWLFLAAFCLLLLGCGAVILLAGAPTPSRPGRPQTGP
jgi:hypothetical protein